MPANTKVNLSISDEHQPASMQMNRRMYLISRDKEFSNQFSVHFSINSVNVNKRHAITWSRALSSAFIVT